MLYDYIGCNPAKGGIFRSGPMDKGDGVTQNWIGHSYFELGTLALTVRRMPTFTHVSLSSLFFFGHLWHASRALFRDLWTGVTVESMYLTQY